MSSDAAAKDELQASYTELSRKLAESLAHSKKIETENDALKAQLASIDQQGNSQEKEVQELYA